MAAPVMWEDSSEAPQSPTLIQQLIQGMHFGLTVDQMARGQYYIHPALPEVVEQALLEL